MWSFEICTLQQMYYRGDKIKGLRLASIWHAWERLEMRQKLLVRKPEQKRPRGRITIIWILEKCG